MEIKSPNLVTHTFINNTLDFLIPKIKELKPTKINFQFGTLFNGTPHIGTYMTQAFAFVLAESARKRFNIDTAVIFKALDHGSYDTKIVDGIEYQLDYCKAVSEEERMNKINEYYIKYFDMLSNILNGIPYTINHYSKDQAGETFRKKLIETMPKYEKIRDYLKPTTGNITVRVACPYCNYFDKDGINTSIIECKEDYIKLRSYCFEHGWYESDIRKDNDTYVNVDTIYRNIIKETIYCDCKDNELFVMIKGLDWGIGSYYLDLGLETCGYKLGQVPILRIFTPQIVSPTGAKLAKSELKQLSNDYEPWIKNAQLLLEDEKNVRKIVLLCQKMINNYNNMFRCYSIEEFNNLLNQIIV